MYYATAAWCWFVTDSGAAQAEPTELLIAQPTAANGRLPSLLGWDILQRLEVFLDWTTQRVELR